MIAGLHPHIPCGLECEALCGGAYTSWGARGHGHRVWRRVVHEPCTWWTALLKTGCCSAVRKALRYLTNMVALVQFNTLSQRRVRQKQSCQPLWGWQLHVDESSSQQLFVARGNVSFRQIGMKGFGSS